MALTRTTSGLLLQEDFSAAHGWTAETGFSRTADPTLITWGRIREMLAPLAEGQSDYDGCREPTPVAVPLEKRLYLFYDAGDGDTGWRPHVAISTDRGITFGSREVVSSGLDDGDSGEYDAVAVGMVFRWEGEWFHHRITCGAIYTEPLAGLPAGEYGYDVWSGPVYNSWEYVRTIPLGAGGSWCDTELLPGSTVEDDGNFYHFVQGRASGGNYKIGYGTSSTPHGTITINATPILSRTDFYGDDPENPRGVLHVGIGRWCIFVNLIHGATGLYTGRNGVAVSATSSVSDWTGKKTYITQSLHAACDDVGDDVVGVATPIMASDCSTFEEDGYLVGMYDCNPRDGNHLGRRCYGLVWEPSTHCLTFSDATTTRYRYYKSFSHSDFVAEFAALYPTGPVASSDVAFEFRVTSGAGYRLILRNGGSETLRLEKMDGTTIANGTGTVIDAGVSNRIRVRAVGTSIKAWINKELQIDTTDGTYSSGTEVAFSGRKCDAQIRNLAIYSSTTLTLTGLYPGDSYWLRTHGHYAALPVVQITADEDGEATWDGDHYPVSRLSYGSYDDVQTSDRLLWGGDTVELSANAFIRPASGGGGLPVFGSD